jgi:dTDP-glucose 4,6-dehydratase
MTKPKDYHVNRLLVTGGAGFIGANFVHYWLARNRAAPIIVLDALTYAGNRDNFSALEGRPNFNFVQGDIRDQTLVEQLIIQYNVDTLVHFAAESHVDRSISGPDAFINTNVIGTHSLLKAARKAWTEQGGFAGKRFHHVSTDEVYGTLRPMDPAFTERTPYAPNSPYSASKAASDHLVRAYHHTYGLPVTTSNCSNNYGPYQFPEKLLPLCLLNILHGKPLPIYGDGQQVRDWLHVDDHNHGIALVLQKGVVGETYNIGGNNEWANLDTVKLLCDIVDELLASDASLRECYPQSPTAQGRKSASLITFVADRPGHDTRYAIDATKITRELGYQPQHTFAAGLRQTVLWYLGNENWWRTLLARQTGRLTR